MRRATKFGLATGFLLFTIGLSGDKAQAAGITSPILAHPAGMDTNAVTPVRWCWGHWYPGSYCPGPGWGHSSRWDGGWGGSPGWGFGSNEPTSASEWAGRAPLTPYQRITARQCLYTCLRWQRSTGTLYGDVNGTLFCIDSCL